MGLHYVFRQLRVNNGGGSNEEKDELYLHTAPPKCIINLTIHFHIHTCTYIFIYMYIFHIYIHTYVHVYYIYIYIPVLSEYN